VGRGHPTDADREDANAPTVAAALVAARAGDGAAFAQLLADHGAWLASSGRADGPLAAVASAERALSQPAGSRREWAEPQLKGAHAVLRYSDRRDGALTHGALVLEARAGRIVLVAEAP
jgi:hypothetical protein